jgi:hypothetical protein
LLFGIVPLLLTEAENAAGEQLEASRLSDLPGCRSAI